jgi:hypothetical protein
VGVLLEVDLLVFLDFGLHLPEHLHQLSLILGQFIDDEVIVIDFLAVFGAENVVAVCLLYFIGCPLGVSPALDTLERFFF